MYVRVCACARTQVRVHFWACLNTLRVIFAALSSRSQGNVSIGDAQTLPDVRNTCSYVPEGPAQVVLYAGRKWVKHVVDFVCMYKEVQLKSN